MKKQIPGIFRELRAYKPREIDQLDLDALPFTGRIVNDRKVSDHHAIIPAGALPTNLPSTEQRVFDAVVTRFIAAFYPPCLKEVTTVDGMANEVPFRARGVRVIRPGWTELEQPGAKTRETTRNRFRHSRGAKLGHTSRLSSRARHRRRGTSPKTRCSARWRRLASRWKMSS